MPLACIASWTRRQGWTRGPPSSPWHTYRVGRSASISDLELVDPRRGRHDPVAALGPVGPDRDHLEAVLAALERTDHRRAHPDDIPALELVNLVVEPDPPRAADHHVRLLLLSMAVGYRGSNPGPVV